MIMQTAPVENKITKPVDPLLAAGQSCHGDGLTNAQWCIREAESQRMRGRNAHAKMDRRGRILVVVTNS